MYPVSEAYLAARRSRVREERITGGIKLKDGTIITIDDTVIIQNSLSISKKVCSSGKFDIGTMNCSVLEMKLIDDSAYDHEFGGALIKLTYGLVTGVDEGGNKVWEEVPLPPFFADGSEVTRKWNVVTITAYDPISLLNIDYPDTIPTDSLYSALQYVCTRAGIGLAITEDEFNQLPNSGVKPDFSSAQVVSCLDVAMWIAQTVNCCGFIDYRGLLDLKQYNYAGGNTYDRLITEDEIKDIKYSDTRTYLAYLQAYVNGEARLYSKVSAWTGADAPHTKEGALSLPKNPILSQLTEAEQAAVNSSYLENRSSPTRYIKMTGWVDPALELMDVVAFSGSMIDVGQIINVATQIKWCYGKSGTIYCASVSERSETAGEASSAAVMALAVTEEEAGSSINRVQPKSQIEKRLDDIEAELKSSGSTSTLVDYEYLTDQSVKYNGITYTVEKDSETGLISKISDSYNHEFTPVINSGITDVALHNAVFWAVAMISGLSELTIMPVTAGLVGYFDYKRQCSPSLWTNRLGGDNIAINGNAEVNVDCLQMPSGTHGTFSMPYTDGILTVYAVLKCSDKSGTGLWGLNYILGTGPMDGAGKGRCLCEYNETWHFSNGVYDIGSEVSPLGDYHVIAVTCDANSEEIMYIDGVKVDSASLSKATYGDTWGLNYMGNDTTGNAVSYLTTHFKMLAFGREAHSAAQIANNSAWLKNHYGI